MRGNLSNLSLLYKILNSRIPNCSNFPRSSPAFSSLHSNDGVNDMKNTHKNDDTDKFVEENGENVNAHKKFPPNPIPGRPLRGNYRRRGGDDEYFGGDGGKFGAKLSHRGRKNVGFGEGDEKKKDSFPSISEFLSRPLKEEEGDGGGNSDFLDKFKLGDVGKKENESDLGATLPSQEDKMEPPRDADVIFKKMKESGLIPNAVAMLDGLCKDGLIQEAMKLFGLMREKGTMPEVVIYTAVVDGFCQAQKLHDAKRIFRKMQSNGIVPNAFSYGVLIRGLCKGKNLEDAVDFCIEMLEAGHSPNVSTFTGLVDELCKEKGVEEARKAIEALVQKGFYVNEKAVREHLDKKGPTSSMVWEAIFGPKKSAQRSF